MYETKRDGDFLSHFPKLSKNKNIKIVIKEKL